MAKLSVKELLELKGVRQIAFVQVARAEEAIFPPIYSVKTADIFHAMRRFTVISLLNEIACRRNELPPIRNISMILASNASRPLNTT